VIGPAVMFALAWLLRDSSTLVDICWRFRSRVSTRLKPRGEDEAR